MDELVFSITSQELQKRRLENLDFLLLDVREPEEFTIANIGGRLIPLAQLQERLAEILEYRHRNIVVLCHHGIRSAHATQFLRENGFSRVQNLSGGIDDWSRNIDPTIPRY